MEGETKLERKIHDEVDDKKEQLINRLQQLYDNNKLSDKDEITILDALEYLGGEISW